VTTKRKKGIVLLVCGVVVIGMSLFLFGDGESQPKYQGRALSAWLATYDDLQPETFEQAREAVLHIGTNALPNLLSWIQYEPPAWRAPLRRVLPSRLWDNESFQRFIAGRAEMRAKYGRAGFEILGTNAIAALPELERLIKNNTAPVTALRSLFAITSIGESSLPVLERALADTNQIYRSQIPRCLWVMAMKDGPAAYLPLMHQALTNDDKMVRTVATNLLRDMEMPPTPAR
jgi:hypothetical protein